MNTIEKGNFSVAKVIVKFLEKRYIVAQPVGEGYHYDLVVDIKGTLYRVQVKTGSFKNGCVCSDSRINCNRKSRNHKSRKRKNYTTEIDYFAIYCPKLDKVYLVPVDEHGYLRVDAPKRNTCKNINWAKDYEI